MSEFKLIGSSLKRLSKGEQKRLDISAAKNGHNPVLVTDDDTHIEATINGLSEAALNAFSVVLRDEKK